MKAARLVVLLYLLTCLVLPAGAEQGPRTSRGHGEVLFGGNPDTAKAGGDSLVLIGPWGSGAAVNGQFENPAGQPAWNGWTHRDVTEPEQHHWQVSDYRALDLGLTPGPDNLAAWCGDLAYTSCAAEDPEGGYGNSWREALQWTGTVADPGAWVEVLFSAYANLDTEPGYDYVYLRYRTPDAEMQVAAYDGVYPGHYLEYSFTLTPMDYMGPGADQVVLEIVFESDGGWSDEDCMWPTAGALQIDDITVSLDQGSGPVVDFCDFQSGFSSWEPVLPLGVGDFAQIWSGLEDVDPCQTNYSPQVAFIDDGEVVPGVGPSLCIDWCYGPYGYIVNTTGGRLGSGYHLHNVVESPVIPWPEGDYEGALLEAGIYRHEDLMADSPGMFYIWNVRSTGSDDPEDIQAAPWVSRNFVYYGGPDYIRMRENISDLMDPGRRFVQVQLGLYEIGFVWDWNGNDGTPAPYFDSVRLTAYPHPGPAIMAREIDLAQDSFPAIGEVDLVNLGNNSVRFDMASNISPAQDLRNDPGDSLVADIVPVRAGSELLEAPRLYWKMKQNPLFDEFRTNVEFGPARTGYTEGYPARNNNGVMVEGKWAFDLPDSNFLFPGDVLHYYIVARDDNGEDIRTATLPADTTGYSDFGWPLAFHSSYTVRGLPSLREESFNPGQFFQPELLFWNDFGRRGGENEWHFALANLGWIQGLDYDTYYTNGPSSGVGNGLGGRATAYSLAGYDGVLYSCGDLSYNTLGFGDFNEDPSQDVQVLDSWLRQGGKSMLLTGDNLVSDLSWNSQEGINFVQDWLGVTLINWSLRPLVSNQASPLVRAIPGGPVYFQDPTWIAYGGCPGINTFDAVEVSEGAVRLAEFLDPAGSAGAYGYSAATLMEVGLYGSKVVSLPYDFLNIHTVPDQAKDWAPLPARVTLLDGILSYLGFENWIGFPMPVPGAAKLDLRSWPNPFNPVTRIAYEMPRAGHLSLKVYDLKGQLVRTLIDERIESSGHVMWDGTDDRGQRVGSGVYFAEARTAGQVKVQKMALVK